MSDEEFKERLARMLEVLTTSKAETDKVLAASKAEMDRVIKELAESQKETEKLVKKTGEQLRMTDKQVKETGEQLRMTDKQVKETSEEVRLTEKLVKETSKMIGSLGGRIGVVVELLLIPGICKEINRYGHEFVLVCPNANIRKEKLHTQVDVMLYDTTEAMAIEIKTRLDKDDVEWHIYKRLAALRELEKEFNIKDKTLYGAVAGISIDDRARELALKNGLYVIEMRENEKIPLIVEAPLNNKPNKW